MRHIMGALIILTLLCGGVYAESQVAEVSIIQLTANPEKYDGTLIRVKGFFHMEHEGTAIYLSKEDSEQWLTKNGLWANVPETVENQVLNNKYVLIEGTFNSKDKGHRGMWSGSIQDIKRIQLYGAELVENLKKSIE